MVFEQLRSDFLPFGLIDGSTLDGLKGAQAGAAFTINFFPLLFSPSERAPLKTYVGSLVGRSR